MMGAREWILSPKTEKFFYKYSPFDEHLTPHPLFFMRVLVLFTLWRTAYPVFDGTFTWIHGVVGCALAYIAFTMDTEMTWRQIGWRMLVSTALLSLTWIF